MTFKVACVVGTRPEIIKMAPLVDALNKNKLFSTHIICSGQHRELLLPLLDWFNVKIDINFDLMENNQNLNRISSKILAQLGMLFEEEYYDCVLGQGDTTTTLMAALAAFNAKIPFLHVEAGLRTYNRHAPFPEEMNRVLITRLASFHFAPTLLASNNLNKEGIPAEKILITGNTVIDSLFYTLKKLPAIQKKNKKEILVTVHRRESLGEPLIKIGNALANIAIKHPDVSILFPVHPNPAIKEIVHTQLQHLKNIILVNSLSYDKLIQAMQNSYLVLTDSGGIQEEAPALKKPVLILRTETDRPELVDCGGAVLVGSDEKLIVNTVDLLLNHKEHYQNLVIGYSPFGDGRASSLIVNKLVELLGATALTKNVF